jgi:hypothetical protein
MDKHLGSERGALTMTYTQVWDAMKNQPSDSMIQRDEDGAFIPMDADNIDCQEYLAWLDAGGVPAACSPPAVTLPKTLESGGG